jgi:hypothetical protein
MAKRPTMGISARRTPASDKPCLRDLLIGRPLQARRRYSLSYFCGMLDV